MNIIVAVYSDWGIGYNGKQPLVLPEDRRRFKELTSGGIVIVGRKTFESFPEPLPGRKHIILTRNHNYTGGCVTVRHTVDDVLADIGSVSPEKVFVIGGGEIYRLLLPMCACAYITRIDTAPVSDTFFPDLNNTPGWSLESREFGIWSSEFGIDMNSDQGLSCNPTHHKNKDNVIRYSFDLYKNASVHGINSYWRGCK